MSASAAWNTVHATEIAHAAQRLAAGHLVAFPTETVYGLGADALNVQALARLYAAKARPQQHPVIVHLAPRADVAFWTSHIPPEAVRLIDAFWPGPLTLILPRATSVPDAVTGGQESVGLRCPAHPVAQALLTAFATLMPSGQGGVAAPSANRFGHVSPTCAAHVCSEFPDLIPEALCVLDGGAAQVGIESTILDVSRLHLGGQPVLLRPGHILVEDIAQAIGRDIYTPDATSPRASGTLKAHYAPRTRLEIWSQTRLCAQHPVPSDGQVAVLVFQRIDSLPQGYVQHLCAADPEQYARDLYAILRDLDQGGYARIVLQAPPVDAHWQAVNDRIARAAAAFSP